MRVLPSGVKEFFYRYRAKGEGKTLALGRYDFTGKNGKTLAEIRKVLREKLMTEYVEALKAARKPSARDVERIFKRNARKPFSSLVDTKASEIEPGHIQQILAWMVKAGVTRQVNVTRTYLRAAFAFGAKADHDPRTVARDGVLFGLKYNPVAVVPRIAEYERVGERTLSEDELRDYWKALDALPVMQQAILRFNVAIGCQRIAQLLRADWTAFSFDDETLLLHDFLAEKPRPWRNRRTTCSVIFAGPLAFQSRDAIGGAYSVTPAFGVRFAAFPKPKFFSVDRRFAISARAEARNSLRIGHSRFPNVLSTSHLRPGHAIAA